MLKVGLIGVGYLGKIHLGLLLAMKEIEFVGFFDTNTENSQHLIGKYNIQSWSSSKDLIDACDMLIIVSPTSTHSYYANECIKKGKHVFVEKPVTSNLAEAIELKESLQPSGVSLQIGMVERFNPAFVAVKELVKNPVEIFCNRLAPFTTRGADVSVVFDVMIHDIDLVLSVTDSKVKSIKSFGEKIVSSTWDTANAIVEFETGLIAHFTASRCAERKYRMMDIIDLDEVFEVDLLNKKTTRFINRGSTKESLKQLYLQQNRKALTAQNIQVVDFNAIETELKSFMESIINNKKVVVSLDDGIGAMQLARDIESCMSHQN